MKYSAGLVLISNNKILLGHPTGAKWQASFSIPKGLVDVDESIVGAAIRETSEEVGIKVPPELITAPQRAVDYTQSNGKKYKTVYYFVVDVSGLSIPSILPQKQLQLAEIDYAAFFDKEEAKKVILKSQLPVLEHL